MPIRAMTASSSARFRLCVREPVQKRKGRHGACVCNVASCRPRGRCTQEDSSSAGWPPRARWGRGSCSRRRRRTSTTTCSSSSPTSTRARPRPARRGPLMGEIITSTLRCSMAGSLTYLSEMRKWACGSLYGSCKYALKECNCAMECEFAILTAQRRQSVAVGIVEQREKF